MSERVHPMREIQDGFYWQDGHLLRIKGDYWTRWLPDRTVRHILRSYWHDYWKPRFIRGDSHLWPGLHFSWWELAKQTFRLVFLGYTEYRYD